MAKSELNLSGKTKLYGLMGYPIDKSLSPAIHNRLAAHFGHDMVYVPFPVAPDNLEQAVGGAAALGIQGFNVTAPHKQSIMPLLHGLDISAEKVGAVNTVAATPKGYIGHNTDAAGLAKAVERQGIRVADRPVVVLGAGGAAYAAAVMAAEKGAAEIIFVNRTKKNAENLVHHMKTYYNTKVRVLSYETLAQIEAQSVVIQATSIGMGDSTGVSPASIAPAHLNDAFFAKISAAIELIYNPVETEFLRQVRTKAVGSLRMNGLGMLIYQAFAAYEIWHGVTVPDTLTEEAARLTAGVET